MDIEFGAEHAAFTDEVRTWLDEHLVGEFAEYRGVGSPTDDSHWDLRIAWEKELSAGHWLGLTWPKEYGGRGASLIEEIIFEYEYARAAAPARVNQQALELLGPTLLEYGTHEQKSRFIPAILSVDEVWGQGFSEPTAGSDLASVSTKARLSDGQWVIDGQKVWTTFGDRADWLYVLCRTDPDASLRHRGLTLLLVPVDQPGVQGEGPGGGDVVIEVAGPEQGRIALDLEVIAHGRAPDGPRCGSGSGGRPRSTAPGAACSR